MRLKMRRMKKGKDRCQIGLLLLHSRNRERTERIRSASRALRKQAIFAAYGKNMAAVDCTSPLYPMSICCQYCLYFECLVASMDPFELCRAMPNNTRLQSLICSWLATSTDTESTNQPLCHHFGRLFLFSVFEFGAVRIQAPANRRRKSIECDFTFVRINLEIRECLKLTSRILLMSTNASTSLRKRTRVNVVQSKTGCYTCKYEDH